MSRTSLLLSGLVALSVPAAAQTAEPATAAPATAAIEPAPIDPVVEKIFELEREDPRVMEHLEYLTKRIGPRLTGSPNFTRSCHWAKARFESFGLKAWLEPWGEFPVGFERGPSSGAMVAPLTMDYVFTTNAWTAGTPGPVRGAAVFEPDTLEGIEELLPELAGQWIVERPRSLRAKASVRRKVRKALEEVAIAGWVRNANSGDYVYAFGSQDVDWDDLPSICSINLLQAQYEDLAERLERGEEVELEFDVDNRFLPGPVEVYNVIAELEGTEFPDEYVIVGGHLDSWDPAEGAQDNGTGVATTLEAARLLAEAGARPRRTIRFHLWGGEEEGLLGSRGYVESHPDEMEKISGVFVHDQGTNALVGLDIPKNMGAQAREAFAPLLTMDSNLGFVLKENDGLPLSGGSDHRSFLGAGVPGFAWQQRGRTSYRHSWHTQYDTLEFAVPEYQEHSSVVAAIGAYGVANLDSLLEREGLLASGAERDRARRQGQRRMGVFLDENEVTRVTEDSKAEAAGWQEGDLILAIDGVEVEGRREIAAELQKGGPKKVFKLERGDEVIESVLDYTGDPSELARAKREAEEKAAAEASAEAGEDPKEAAPATESGR